MKPVRTAARALIIQEDKLLVIKMRDSRGIFHILPGGGQRPGETLEQTVRRECQEELGVEIVPRQFAYVREYIGKNHTFRHIHSQFHQVEVVFYAELSRGSALGKGHEEDKKQVGWSWLPLAELHDQSFYPNCIIEGLQTERGLNGSGYLGDVN